MLWEPRRPGRLLLLLSVLLVPLGPAAAQSGQRRVPKPGGAEEQRRVALIVGNDAYPKMPLKNAVNDARSVARTLREIGFDVESVENADRPGLERAIKKFIGRISPGDVGLFYFSGHGIQIEGQNYLIPTDFSADDEIEAKFRAIPADLVRERMEGAGSRLNLLVFDACRDNPFRTTRSGSSGLARMEPGRGTVILMATGPGKTASDNPGGQNGLFTKHFLFAMKAPGVKLRDAIVQVREGVDTESNHRQTPWILENVIGEFYLNPGKAGAPAESPAPADLARGAEIVFWESIKDSDRADDYEAYLQQYPKGSFSQLARVRISRLTTRPAQVQPAPQPTPKKPTTVVAQIGAGRPSAPPAFGTAVRENRAAVSKPLCVVEVQRIVQESAVGKESLARIQRLQAQKQDDLTRRQNELKGLEAKIQANSRSLSEEALERLQKEYQGKALDLKRFQDDAQRELEEAQRKELSELEKKVLPVIEGVAKDYQAGPVLNKFQSGLLFVDSSRDITDLVIRRFNASPYGATGSGGSKSDLPPRAAADYGLVVEVQRIVQESAVGKESTAKVQKLQAQKQDELTRRQNELKGLETRIQGESRSLSEQAVERLQKEYQQKALDLKRFQDDSQRELEEIQRKELSELEKKVLPLIEAVAKGAGATAILNKFQSGLLYADFRCDATDSVIQRLDGLRDTSRSNCPGYYALVVDVEGLVAGTALGKEATAKSAQASEEEKNRTHGEIEKKLMPIIDEYARGVGATLVFNKFKSGLLFADDEGDRTADLIALVDAKLGR